MGYDRGDSFLFDLEPKGNPFGSKSKGKLSARSYPIQLERKWNTIFLSVSVREPIVSRTQMLSFVPLKHHSAVISRHVGGAINSLPHYAERREPLERPG